MDCSLSIVIVNRISRNRLGSWSTIEYEFKEHPNLHCTSLFQIVGYYDKDWSWILQQQKWYLFKIWNIHALEFCYLAPNSNQNSLLWTEAIDQLNFKWCIVYFVTLSVHLGCVIRNVGSNLKKRMNQLTGLSNFVSAVKTCVKSGNGS